ncbi:hypothetical protein Hanom_Chr12g01127161 [Helianthus anomalus]
MAKIPNPDGYTRNSKYLGRVYPIPNGYWAGIGMEKKIFCWYRTSMRLDDTRPDYPKLYILLPKNL